MLDFKDHICLKPNEILAAILGGRMGLNESLTYIIAGRTGPTGKSWLRRKLDERGYKAFEISESLTLFRIVEFTDEKNHMIFDPFNEAVLIILNERLEDSIIKDAEKRIGISGIR